MKPKVSVMEKRIVSYKKLMPTFDQFYGTYDLETKNIEVMGSKNANSIDKIIEVINHEYLHHILHKEVNECATIALDNIDNQENSLYRELD